MTVIGHSLGGTLARFLVTNFPDKVRHAVALGSPLDPLMQVHPLALLTFQMLYSVQRVFGQTSPDCGSNQCACRFAQSISAPLSSEVGFTSIFTKRDEIVDWRSSIDPSGENREVQGRHIGLIVNREVYRILANTLANNRADSLSIPH